tara:strand:- start:1158 stop:1895 length:738 start_codon:yes stop_codon:yes gene_type:complete
MLNLKQALGLTDLKKAFDTYSLDFNGTDESITIDSMVGLINTSEGSVSLWCKLDTTSSNGTLFRTRVDGNNYISLLYHASTNQMRFEYKAGGTLKQAKFSDAIENDGLWHHIVGTWSASGDELKIYLDGTLKNTTTGLGTWSGTLIDADLGQNLTGGAFYNGKMSNVAIFNTVLSLANVLHIQNRSNAVATRFYPMDITNMSGLKSYYRLGLGSGTIALDSSGNGNNGTLVNTPTWSTTTPTYNN